MSTHDTPAGARTFRLVLPAVEVIPFPVVRRIGKIRHTAELMHSTTRRGAEAVWQQAIDGMRRQMERAGIDEALIQRELQDFWQAVRDELNWRSYGSSWFDGGDAA